MGYPRACNPPYHPQPQLPAAMMSLLLLVVVDVVVVAAPGLVVVFVVGAYLCLHRTTRYRLE